MALNDALNSAAPPGGAGRCHPAAGRAPAASAPAGSRARVRPCRRALLLRLVRGMYGQVTYHGQAGTATLAFERGTVQAAGGGHLVVRAPDGTAWTWGLASNTVVRERGTIAPGGALRSGARVFVAGQVSGASKDARLVLVRAAGGGNSPGSSPQAPASPG